MCIQEYSWSYKYSGLGDNVKYFYNLFYIFSKQRHKIKEGHQAVEERCDESWGPSEFQQQKTSEVYWPQTHLFACFIASWCTEYCFGGITL